DARRRGGRGRLLEPAAPRARDRGAARAPAGRGDDRRAGPARDRLRRARRAVRRRGGRALSGRSRVDARTGSGSVSGRRDRLGGVPSRRRRCTRDRGAARTRGGRGLRPRGDDARDPRRCARDAAGRDVPDRPVVRRAQHRRVVRRQSGRSGRECCTAVTAIALDLDVLGDTRPLWNAFVADVSRRAHVDPDRLEEELPNWRVLLERFAEDHAPVYLRPSAPATAALRRLHAAGVRLGAFTDVPEELARVALAPPGGSRRIEALEAGPGALERLLVRLPGARVVRTLADLDS